VRACVRARACACRCLYTYMRAMCKCVSDDTDDDKNNLWESPGILSRALHPSILIPLFVCRLLCRCEHYGPGRRKWHACFRAISAARLVTVSPPRCWRHADFQERQRVPKHLAAAISGGVTRH